MSLRSKKQAPSKPAPQRQRRRTPSPPSDGGEGRGENSPKHSRIEPLNRSAKLWERRHPCRRVLRIATRRQGCPRSLVHEEGESSGLLRFPNPQRSPLPNLQETESRLDSFPPSKDARQKPKWRIVSHYES